MGEMTNFYEILICKYEWMSLFWRLEGTGTVPYAACVQLYPPEDEHLRLETCRGE